MNKERLVSLIKQIDLGGPEFVITLAVDKIISLFEENRALIFLCGFDSNEFIDHLKSNIDPVVKYIDKRVGQAKNSNNELVQLLWLLKYALSIAIHDSIKDIEKNYYMMSDLVNMHMTKNCVIIQCACAAYIISKCNYDELNCYNSYYYDIKSKFRIRYECDLLGVVQAYSAAALIKKAIYNSKINYAQSLYDDIVKLSEEHNENNVIRISQAFGALEFMQYYTSNNKKELSREYSDEFNKILVNLPDCDDKRKLEELNRRIYNGDTTR